MQKKTPAPAIVGPWPRLELAFERAPTTLSDACFTCSYKQCGLCEIVASLLGVENTGTDQTEGAYVTSDGTLATESQMSFPDNQHYPGVVTTHW